MTKAEQAQRDQAIELLRKHIKPGDTLYTVLRHVSRSGMQRRIDVYRMEDGEPFYLSGYVARALGRRISQESGGGIVCGGAGMDMGFELVYSLSLTLFPEYQCLGQRNSVVRGVHGCPSNTHVNSGPDRDTYGPKVVHTDGYALHHRWI